VLPAALGLLLASKQYMVLAIPLAYLLVPDWRDWRRYLLLVLGAVMIAAVVSAPLVLWDWHAFVHSAGVVQKLAPFRDDALSYLVWIDHQWHRRLDEKAGFVAAGLALIVALWRCPRDAGGFAAGLAVVYLPFIAFNKQAFANYYLFVIGALCCAVAAAPVPAIERKSEPAPVR